MLSLIHISPMRSADEEYEFSVDRNFYYYTGIDREHMILVLKKLKEGTMAEELYIEPFDEVMAKWVGARMRENEAREISGCLLYTSVWNLYQWESMDWGLICYFGRRIVWYIACSTMYSL